MSLKKLPETCPHCGCELLRWNPPTEAGWEPEAHLVCFNDECPYYKKGWEHTMAAMKHRASYRYRYIPETEQVSPLPVWTEDALKDQIVPEDRKKLKGSGDDE